MNVPVIATNVGGTSEIIAHNKTGILIDRHSPELIEKYIQDFIKNKSFYYQLTENGAEVVKKHFDFNLRTKKLEQLYIDLLKNK